MIQRWALLGLMAALVAAALAACGSAPVAPAAPQAAAATAPSTTSTPAPSSTATPPAAAAALGRSGANGSVAGRSERLLVYLPARGDTLAGIAERFLGHANLAWRIADANSGGAANMQVNEQVTPDTPLIVPLMTTNPIGVTPEGAQTIPILCYHRFGTGASKMIVSPAQFELQLDWLARNHYRVLRLAELQGFLAAREALPQRSVVITIDDGYESVYRHAYPALKKFGFSATLFVYSDFVGARDGLSWPQLQEMHASGVIDVQAHSKSHRNLVERSAGETDASWRNSIEAEVRQPRVVLERGLAAVGARVRHFAYPFGDANEAVLDTLLRHEFELGVTVNPGGNPFFAHPYMLRRTMIFGDHDLQDFKARLQTRRSWARP